MGLLLSFIDARGGGDFCNKRRYLQNLLSPHFRTGKANPFNEPVTVRDVAGKKYFHGLSRYCIQFPKHFLTGCSQRTPPRPDSPRNIKHFIRNIRK